MSISLENWIRNKLQEVEENIDYIIATDTIRCWIDEYNNLFKKENKKKKTKNIKLKWWQYLYAYPLKWAIEFTLFILMRKINYVSNKKQDFKRNLKYFNPIIKKDFLGNNKIEWVGRDKPLTDEEVEALWKT